MTTTFDTLKASTRLAASAGGSTARSVTRDGRNAYSGSRQRCAVQCSREPRRIARQVAMVPAHVLRCRNRVPRARVGRCDAIRDGERARGSHVPCHDAYGIVGTALAAVIVGLEGVTMTFLKREREKGRREGRLEGRREGRREAMRERDRAWKDWQERLKKDPNAEPPPPPKDDD